MRQPDINRVKRAKDHLKAATTQLRNIVWSHTTEVEDSIIGKAKDLIIDTDRYLDDLINLNKQQ